MHTVWLPRKPQNVGASHNWSSGDEDDVFDTNHTRLHDTSVQTDVTKDFTLLQELDKKGAALHSHMDAIACQVDRQIAGNFVEVDLLLRQKEQKIDEAIEQQNSQLRDKIKEVCASQDLHASQIQTKMKEIVASQELHAAQIQKFHSATAKKVSRIESCKTPNVFKHAVMFENDVHFGRNTRWSSKDKSLIGACGTFVGHADLQKLERQITVWIDQHATKDGLQSCERDLQSVCNKVDEMQNTHQMLNQQTDLQIRELAELISKSQRQTEQNMTSVVHNLILSSIAKNRTQIAEDMKSQVQSLTHSIDAIQNQADKQRCNTDQIQTSGEMLEHTLVDMCKQINDIFEKVQIFEKVLEAQRSRLDGFGRIFGDVDVWMQTISDRLNLIDDSCCSHPSAGSC